MSDTPSSGTASSMTNTMQPPMTGTQASGGAGSTTASGDMEPRAKEQRQKVTEHFSSEQQQSEPRADQTSNNAEPPADQPSGQHGHGISGQRTEQQKVPQSQKSDEDEA